jgi:hypothetical protein
MLLDLGLRRRALRLDATNNRLKASGLGLTFHRTLDGDDSEDCDSSLNGAGAGGSFGLPFRLRGRDPDNVIAEAAASLRKYSLDDDIEAAGGATGDSGGRFPVRRPLAQPAGSHGGSHGGSDPLASRPKGRLKGHPKGLSLSSSVDGSDGCIDADDASNCDV